jgi:DNA-binding transcriptional ArsR family regulator
MREDGLVTGRRDAQTIYYSLSNSNAEKILAVLKDIYCTPTEQKIANQQSQN